MTRRRITVEERRARLGRRHGLAQRHEGVEATARSLVGIHSTDPVSVHLAAAARGAGGPDEIEKSLYDDRRLLRMLGMRRTLFVEPLDLVPVIQAACTDDLVVKERKRAAGWFEASGLATDGQAYIDELIGLVVAFLADVGEATTREMNQALPALDARFLPGGSPKWATPQSVGSRIVFLASTTGLIARGRPLGSWVSSQYRLAPIETWMGGPIPAMDPAEARTRLASSWLATFGPGTVTDLRWWTGWTMGQTRSALAAVSAVEVEVDGGAAHVLPDDLDEVEPPDAWAALLPSLDPTTMGWKERDWYLGGHAGDLFDRNGNAGPTVWWNGAMVGGWARRPDGGIVVEFLEPVDDECRSTVAAHVDRLTAWIGDTRFTPRFRTPLERRLTA